MNYKKGILSVVLWFIYAIIVGTGMVGTAMSVILPSGESQWIGLVIAGIWLAVTGLVVFLLHKFFPQNKGDREEEKQQIHLVIESILLVALIAAGIALRVREILMYDLSREGSNIWFETVKITENVKIPQVVHGAVYFYLQVLHGLLLFLGNKITVALVFQMILQILTGVFLYFAIRRLTGTVAAVVVTGYWMLCPLLFPVVVLGPESLYLLLWMIGLCVIAEALGRFQVRGNEQGIRPIIGFFAGGMVTGVLSYLDITGVLLLFIVLSVMMVETKEITKPLRRVSAAFLGVFGIFVGFFLSIALDALGSGKLMENVLFAWWEVYVPGTFSWPVAYTSESGFVVAFPVIAMVTILAVGVFSFWCQKKVERQSIWLAVMVALSAMICFGMTTSEMQGTSLLYLILAVIAGSGLQAIVPYEEATAILVPAEEPTTHLSKKSKIKIRDLETEETSKVQLIENPLPVPKKHVPRVLDYKLDDDDDGDFDYPVSDDDDFDL